MVYLITGTLMRPEVLHLGHEEWIKFVGEKVAPSLAMLCRETPHGKVLGGGAPAGGRDVVMIVELNNGNSHRCVRQFLASLPLFEYYQWQTTPLETFEEMSRAFGG